MLCCCWLVEKLKVLKYLLCVHNKISLKPLFCDKVVCKIKRYYKHSTNGLNLVLDNEVFGIFLMKLGLDVHVVDPELFI